MYQAAPITGAVLFKYYAHAGYYYAQNHMAGILD